ncbi:LysR family transcriptional regulator [Luteibacter sp. CQ10]
MDTMKRLDLNLLTTLETLLLERNVTRAAERLHLSQPAVSAQLARLRDLFGDPLLLPTRRGMVPTAMAVELLPALCQALDEVRKTLDVHRPFDPLAANLTLTIACTDYVQAAVIQPLAADLSQAAPGIRLAVRHLSPEHLDAQMSTGEVDMALMTPDHGPESVRYRLLYSERYVLIGRKGHPAFERPMTVERFVALDQVVVSLRGGTFTTQVDGMLAALGHTRRVVLSTPSFLFIPRIVATSDVVALVPERLVRGSPESLHIVDAPIPVPPFDVGMLWHERTHAHPGQRWMRDRIGDLVASF